MNRERESLSDNVCCMCGKRIVTQIFKGTGICGENCRKDRDNDHEAWKATDRPKSPYNSKNEISDRWYPR